MSKLEELINELSDEEIEYLQEFVFTEDGDLIPQTDFNTLLENEETSYSQADSVQFALKINLNSVYGVQIMPHFKFADEWQALGASTTLTGRILSKYGLIETIEQYFNPDRESRFEFPLLDNIIVASDDEEFFPDPEKQMLRSSVISDTDSVTGDAIVDTDLYGKISFDELEKKATSVEFRGEKMYYFFDVPIKVNNYINGIVQLDEVEYLYSHKVDKDIYELELEDGKTIKVTEDHSVMVLDENGEPTIEKKPMDLTTSDVCMVA